MTLRYPTATLLPDLAGGAFGTLVCAGVASRLDAGGTVFWIVASLAGAFALFAVLTALRATVRISLAPGALTMHPGGRTVQLDTLASFRLHYYSTRRDREGGWMHLSLTDAAGGRLRIDSRLERFDEVVELSAGAAHRLGLQLEAATIENLNALRARQSLADGRW